MWPFSKRKKGMPVPPPVPDILKTPLPKLPKIRPEDVQQAAGVRVPELSAEEFPQEQATQMEVAEETYFLRSSKYQSLIGVVDEVRKQVGILENTSRSLERSDYNEDRNFEKLLRDLKTINNRLLTIDRIFFKE